MHPRGSPAAFPILWNCEQSYNFDRQVWSTKRICLRRVCWSWCGAECSHTKWIGIAWSAVEGTWFIHTQIITHSYTHTHTHWHACTQSHVPNLYKEIYLSQLSWSHWFRDCLQVSAKRTNVPGLKQYRGRRPNPFFRSRRPFMAAAPFYPSYGYG